MQEFACVCVHLRPISGTVESAHFIQLPNLIKSLRIISPKNPWRSKRTEKFIYRSLLIMHAFLIINICGLLFFETMHIPKSTEYVHQ